MNHLALSGTVIERKALRYTPAGLPALDLVLRHESSVTEAGGERKVSIDLRAVALGDIAEPLARWDIGTSLEARGFLSAQRNGRGTVFHITQIQRSEAAAPSPI